MKLTIIKRYCLLVAKTRDPDNKPGVPHLGAIYVREPQVAQTGAFLACAAPRA